MLVTNLSLQDLRSFAKQLEAVRKDVADNPTRYVAKGLNPYRLIQKITFLLDQVNELLVSNLPTVKGPHVSMKERHKGVYLPLSSYPAEVREKMIKEIRAKLSSLILVSDL